MLVVLACHQLVHKFVAALDDLVDLLYLFLFGLIVMHLLVLIVLRPFYGIV